MTEVKNLENRRSYIDYLSDMLNYTIHVIPKNAFVNYSKKIIIQSFINCALHFGGYKKKYDLEFKNRNTYLKMKNNLAKIIKSQ